MIILLFLGHNLTAVWKHLNGWRIYASHQRYRLLTFDIQTDENINRLDSFTSVVETRRRAAVLRDRSLNAFADTEAAVSVFVEKKPLGKPTDGFALEALSVEKGKMDTEPFLRLKGWAFDAVAGKPARSVWLTIGTGTDERRWPLFNGAYSPVIADHFRNQDLKAVGFESDFSLKTISPGVYPLGLEIVSSNGSAFWRFDVPCQLLIHKEDWKLQSLDGISCQPN